MEPAPDRLRHRVHAPLPRRTMQHAPSPQSCRQWPQKISSSRIKMYKNDFTVLLRKREACQINFTRRRTQTKDSYKSARGLSLKVSVAVPTTLLRKLLQKPHIRHCQLCGNKEINGFVSLGSVFVIAAKRVRVYNRRTGRCIWTWTNRERPATKLIKIASRQNDSFLNCDDLFPEPGFISFILSDTKLRKFPRNQKG